MTPLIHGELLSTLAELNIAVVGFSMVVGMLRNRTTDDSMRHFTLRDVAEIGLMGTVMSMFPLVVHTFGTSEAFTWRLSSGVLFLWQIGGITASIRGRGRANSLVRKERWLISAIVGCFGFVSIALALANIAAPGPLSPARHVACMLSGLTQSGFMFVFAAFGVGRDEGSD